MLRNSLIFTALLLVLGGATYFTGGQNALMGNPIPQESAQAKNLMAAPDFEFKILSGETKNLSDFRGKVLVLNFWASWCAPCLTEFPQLLNLAAKKKDKMVFLAISLDEDERAVEKFLIKMKQNHAKILNAPSVIIARDADKHISRDLFQTIKLPETFLITPRGDIADKIIGASVTFDAPEMLQKIDDLYDALPDNRQN